MSEFHEVELIFQDKECLLEALKQAGYQPEEHDQGTMIDDYYGKQKHKGHIVVRRNQFNGCRDIAFERKENKYVMHADNVDYGRVNRFDLARVTKHYCEGQVKKATATTTKYNILKQYEDEHGDTKIELRVML